MSTHVIDSPVSCNFCSETHEATVQQVFVDAAYAEMVVVDGELCEHMAISVAEQIDIQIATPAILTDKYSHTYKLL